MLPLRAGFSTTIPGIAALLQEDDIAAAIVYAADRGVDILNFSFGDRVDSPVIAHSVRYARSRGVLVVAAAGNTGADVSHYPSGLPGVLSVGASTREGPRASFSTFGQDLDLLAPGQNILTTTLGGAWGPATGTSFSAPLTAGVAALVWSAFPDLTADEVAWRLRLSAGREAEGWTPDFGWGYLDAAAAVSLADPLPVMQLQAVDHRDGAWDLGGTVAHSDLLEWSLSALPESAVVGIEEPELEHETWLAEGVSGQRVGETLGLWDPGSEVGGAWVVRLRARVRGYPPLEERTRLWAGSRLPVADSPAFEIQVGDRGWDVVARWSSAGPDQGALRYSGPTDRFSQETSLAFDHGVRIKGPLPVGPARVEILGRTDDQSQYMVLAETTLVIPEAARILGTSSRGLVPPGTPMERSVDWDGDGNPEVLVEGPLKNLYGDIFRYEIQPDGSVTEEGSSAFLFEGIPVDAADADEDGYAELAVFTLDRWMVLEADSTHAFPRRFVRNGITDSVPLGYVDTGSGLVLLAIAGPRLELLDPRSGYTEIAFADADEDLTSGYASGDFDGDGVVEVAVADLSGNLALFEVTASTLTLQLTLPGSVDLAYSMAAVSWGGDPDLFTAELDPRAPEVAGDIDVASVKIRRWRWNGTTLEPVGVLALAGMVQRDEVQLRELDGDLLLRIRNRVDLISLEPGTMTWGGEVTRSSLGRVDGLALARGLSVDRVWLGAAGEAEGELFALAGTATPGVPSVLRVVDSEPVAGGLWVRLAWDSDACAPGDSLLRSGDVRGAYPLPILAGSVSDTLAPGEEVTYVLYAEPCPPRFLRLTGDPPVIPVPVWEDAENLALNLEAPLENAPSGTPALPDAVWLAGAGGRFPPRSFSADRGGNRILVGVPADADPESLVVVKAWDVNGYPVGGAEESVFSLPPRPASDLFPVLSEVSYGIENGEAFLDVALSGNSGTCPPEFALEPDAADLSLPTGSAEAFRLSLSRPLAAGEYTLRLVGVCAASPLGTSRSFRVGYWIYPNPVRSGEELTFENLEPGSRVKLFDVTGNERLAFRTGSPTDRRSVDALGPGLYFVRLESPEGRLIGIEKVAVIR